MSLSNNLLQAAIKHLSGILSGYLDSFEDPELSKDLWAINGVVLPEDAPLPPVSAQTLKNIEDYHQAIDTDLIAFYNAVEDVKQIIDSFDAVAEAYHADGGWGAADELSRQLLTELTLNYLQFRLPLVYHLMQAFRFVEEKLDNAYYLAEANPDADEEAGSRRLFWQRIAAFFTDVGGYFKETFNSLDTEEDARQLAHFFLLPTAAILGAALAKKGVVANYRWNADPDSETPNVDGICDRTLSVLIPLPDLVGSDEAGDPDVDVALFTSAVFVPREHGGPGLLLSLGGKPEAEIPFTLPLPNDANADGKAEDSTEFLLKLALSAPAGGTVFIPLGKNTDFNIVGSAAAAELKATFEPKDTFTQRLLGSSEGSRLVLGKPQMTLHFRKLPTSNRFLFDLKFVLKESALVLSPGEGDSFIQNVLPPGDFGIALDLGVGLRKPEGGDWGVYLAGGDSLEVTLPGSGKQDVAAPKNNLLAVRSETSSSTLLRQSTGQQSRKKLGPVEIHNITTKLNFQSSNGTGSAAQALTPADASIRSDAQDGLAVEVTTTIAVKLGPLTATLDQMGFTVSLYTAEDGNLNLLDANVGYKAPRGVGIVLDTSTLSGGGYLEFDPEKEQYAGVVQLKFEKITLTAMGLLTTRMPDGTKGFSLLLIIAAEDFPPINLGLGFKLTGVGGLLGFNRTVAVDVLRAGLKNKTLDRVLFPQDPVKNAASIVSTLRSVFPPTPDQYVLGPIAQLSWGKEGLLTANIGLVLEFPNPVRLMLLGQMRACFPNKKKGLLKLNLDLLGVIDFDKGEALVLATLFDSKLMECAVTGDAAFFARWQSEPMFILSAGGFHPAFPAPPELPALSRLALVLSKGKNVQLRMTWYAALTSNTLQHGSRVDLHVSAARFSVDGHLSYDVLIEFDPFGFVALFSAGVGLKWHGRTLASVQLEGALSGPSPWHVKGKATFKIWRFSKSVDFDRTLGQAETLPPLPVVDPKPQLLAALADPINWEATLPQRNEQLVILRTTPEPGIVKVHPLGDVAVRQQVVPLQVTIQQFGQARVAQPQTYNITEAIFHRTDPSQSRSQKPEPILEYFAPGQYTPLTQSERLSRASFESMQAGVKITSGQSLDYGSKDHLRTTTFSYETQVVLADGTTHSRNPGHVPPVETISQQVALGAASRTRQSKSGINRFSPETSPQIQVQAREYVVVQRDDLAPVPPTDGTGTDLSQLKEPGLSSLLTSLKAFRQLHPDLSDNLQVVPRYEAKEMVTQ